MRKTSRFICAGLLTGFSALAQPDPGSQKAPEPGEAARTMVILNGADPAKAVSMMGTSGNFEYVRTEMGGPAVVKGAPYTADAVSESTQPLADGNRIVHSDRTTIARDSQGRTRRDLNPALPGMNAADAPKFSFIYDPTTNTSYTLNHNAHTATKASGRSFNIQVMKGAAEAHAKTTAMTYSDHGMSVQVVNSSSDTGKPVIMNQNAVITTDIPAGVGVASARRAVNKNVKTEDLGKQTIEGVIAEGTRTTVTIAAGQIGNERPIEIVSERWYSPELQAVVLSKHADPRTGENTYRLTGISRNEPDKSLFEVPSSYAVQDAPTVGPDRLILRRSGTPPENK